MTEPIAKAQGCICNEEVTVNRVCPSRGCNHKEFVEICSPKDRFLYCPVHEPQVMMPHRLCPSCGRAGWVLTATGGQFWFNNLLTGEGSYPLYPTDPSYHLYRFNDRRDENAPRWYANAKNESPAGTHDALEKGLRIITECQAPDPVVFSIDGMSEFKWPRCVFYTFSEPNGDTIFTVLRNAQFVRCAQQELDFS